MLTCLHMMAAVLVMAVASSGQFLSGGNTYERYPHLVEFLTDFAHYYCYDEIYVITYKEGELLRVNFSFISSFVICVLFALLIFQ